MSTSSAVSPNTRDNLLGSLFMVVAMALFAIEDFFIKRATVDLPVGEVLALFGAAGAVCFAGLAVLRGEKLFIADALSRSMLVRFLFEFFGRLFYILALALTPLSSATAILLATPIVVVMGAALFFGETVGWRRWSAILVGLLGVLIILQPGSDAFTPLSILAVLGMIGFAGRDLASRAAPKSLSTNALGFYGFVTMIFAGLVYAIWEGRAFSVPGETGLMVLLAAVIAGVCAYSFLMMAMRTGEVASVSPFRYSRLLFGIGLGVVFLGEDISAAMVLGCTLIVAAGLFILLRGNQVSSRA